MDADEALRRLGVYGKWQMCTYLMLCLGFGLPLSFYMAFVFIADTPPYRCALPPNSTASVNETIPMEEHFGKMRRSQCKMLDGNITVPCKYGYYYDPSGGYESTIVSEWDLVCEHASLVETEMMISRGGLLIGSILFARVADQIGRKPVFLFCLWTSGLLSLSKAFAPNFFAYGVIDFTRAIMSQGTAKTSMVITIELFCAEARTMAGTALNFFWVFGCLIISAVAYFIRDWRILQIVITAPLSISVLFYWFIPESIPWLVSNGRYDEAEEIVRRAAKFNKVKMPEVIFDRGVQEEETRSSLIVNSAARGKTSSVSISKRNTKPSHAPAKGKPTFKQLLKSIFSFGKSSGPGYSVFDLVRTPVMRRNTILLLILWIVTDAVYSGLSNTVTYLKGNRYLNFFLYNLVEFPAYAIQWVLLQKWGRRPSLILFNIICGITLAGSIIEVIDLGDFDTTPIIITLSLLGKFAISATFGAIFVITPEIFPTNLRTFGLGVCIAVARMASFLSPYSRVLGRQIPWAPNVLFGVLSLIAAVCSFFIPETVGRPLPETVEDVEDWYKKKPAAKPAVELANLASNSNIETLGSAQKLEVANSL